ncbi:MAG TPA: hypothetical protein VFB61_13510 [Gemmatimonadales bacterium]|nr:hypothetical protein [Gemmatimonadales bacterium]
MPSTALTTYLNDHLAGSVAALELLGHLLERDPGSGRDDLVQIRAEIEEDQQLLQRILSDMGGKESPIRKAAAWLTEKLGQVKLGLDDKGSGELRVLEALEALGLGIQGKLMLWRALEAVSGSVPSLGGIDLQQLQQRAERQFRRVEELRLRAARVALRP